jgi:hemerythrin-like metal-binding protein
LYQIEWSDDLSVGVEQIDDDHKVLIVIINKMIHEVGKNKDLLIHHFDELEDYTRYHFRREEKLMISQCLTDEDRVMVKGHIKEHQRFIKKIPELKKKILFASSADVSFETIDFLVSWLLDHIIVKDLSLSQCFTFNQDTVKDKRKNLLSLLVKKINKRLSLYSKVATY